MFLKKRKIKPHQEHEIVRTLPSVTLGPILQGITFAGNADVVVVAVCRPLCSMLFFTSSCALKITEIVPIVIAITRNVQCTFMTGTN